MGEGDEGKKPSETGRRVCSESKEENQLAARVGPKTETVWGKETDVLCWFPQHGVLRKVLGLGRNNT